MLFYLPRENEKTPLVEDSNTFISSKYKTNKFRQVVEKKGTLHYVKNVDPYKVSCCWEPFLEKEAKDLSKLTTIRTLHRYGAPAFFKPSIFEIVVQIPQRERNYVHAFQIECSTDPVDKWSDIEKEAFQAGFHIAFTTLYTKKKNN